ncbi:MAG: tetratricopeptide repeat protein [Chloroflexota bacterium]|jgi:tetratricopeptide (TPR) repeat protein|nr:tetratricopeptide repeat protein [Chloroflexota bacterium]
MISKYFKSGLNKAKLGLHEEAISDFEKASWEDPQNFEIQFNLGTAYLTIGEFEQSIINFSKAIDINPNNSDAYGNRAVAYVAIGDDKKSEADKIKAIKLGAPIEGINAIIDIVKDKREGSDPFKNLS